MKISLAVQTSSRFKVFHRVRLHAAPVASGGERERQVPSFALRHLVVDKGQPARTFVPHPAPVSLHPRVGRHLHLHLLLLVLPVHLRRGSQNSIYSWGCRWAGHKSITIYIGKKKTVSIDTSVSFQFHL